MNQEVWQSQKGSWVDELHHIFWAYQMTLRLSIGEISFSLAFETEAGYPLKWKYSTLVASYDKQINLEKRLADLVYTSTKLLVIWGKVFKVDDLVLRREEIFQPGQRGKLSPNWKGPYQVEEIVKLKSYRLKQLDGALLL